MNSFKKVALIAFLAQIGYFIVITLAGPNTELIYGLTAMILAYYSTALLVRNRKATIWTSPAIWIVTIFMLYPIITMWATIMLHSTGYLFSFIDLPIHVIEIIVISLLIGLLTKIKTKP